MRESGKIAEHVREIQVVVFGLGSEEYGLPIEQTREIIRLVSVTRLPMVPPYVEGVINLRGEVMPIVNLQKKLHLAETASTDNTRIVVVEAAGKQVGIIVDQVSEVLRVPENAIEPPPPDTISIDSSFIRGVGKVGERLLIMLDIEAVLTREFSVVQATNAAADADADSTVDKLAETSPPASELPAVVEESGQALALPQEQGT
ncbi:MAG: chemotaxis protein CheW [Syntrophothermus sp.]